MHTHQKAHYRLMFQVQVSKRTGMAFQNLFSDIMRYANSNFAPVKPQGSQGDWKNDGHEPQAGRYYQVYAPEQFDEAKAIEKLKEDFSGLLAKWGDQAVYPNGVEEFYFVINDAYRVVPGGYPTTIAILEALRQQHGLKVCKPFLTKDLEDVLLGLPEDKIITVVGFPPNPAEIKVLSFGIVDEVIRHIVENTETRPLGKSLVAPDFEEKIVFNRLTVTGHLLRDANYRCGSLEEYFRANSHFCRQQVRDCLQALYEASLACRFADDPDGATSADRQLFHILNEITPKPPTRNPRLEKELQDAALVVMAYFFEACDIFEEPIPC
jgi:hypothetical protein